ncbi:MAG TPA: ATP-binding protein, partial [bacterium]|nr:ATP-binding protein [bacterium]
NKLIDTLKLHDSAIAASNESIIITDALDDNKIIFVNNAFERISGYTKEEALGRNPRFLHNTNADKNAIEKLRTAIKNKEAVSTELLNCKKDGQEYWIFLSIAPIKNQEGIVTNFVGITQDISYHKKIERHLKHAKEQAEQANKIKSQFLANISHELRTPLNAILNIAHFLETTELTEKQKEYLQVLRNSSNNLFYLINQILDIQILESQELQLNFIAFDFVEFINSVKTHINEVVTKKNLDFIVALDQNIPKILIGDQNRIRQILLNILFNAIKFTDDGYIKLEIKLLSKTNDSCEILFVIADTGIGINDENKKIIFDNFMQVDNSNIRRYGGIGIGLSISKKLITLMNGNISVEDNNPKGTVFKFNITLKLDEKIQDLKIEKMLFDLKDNYKILVAEDDKTNQFIIKNLFNDLNNFSVDIVENGKDAVEYYKTNKYNLILMDIQMPEMDGLTALEYIRNFEKQNNLVAAPAFILSATAIEQFKDKIEKLNITGYIAKPIYPRSFYNQIAKILKIKNSLHPQKSEKTIETNNIVPEKIEENNLSRLLKLSNETIDINKALANIDNEVDLYFILANQYYSDYGSKIAEIKTIFENNQYDKMIFFSHKLVTAAANIGAYKLSKMSKQIENILNDKQELSAELYVAYISELEKVNEMLKEIKQIG